MVMPLKPARNNLCCLYDPWSLLFLSFCICIIIRLYTTQWHTLSLKPFLGGHDELSCTTQWRRDRNQTLAKIFLKCYQTSILSLLIYTYYNPRSLNFSHYDKRTTGIRDSSYRPFFFDFMLCKSPRNIYRFCELPTNSLCESKSLNLGWYLRKTSRMT